MSFPFIVRQTNLPARVIVLSGRSLPYRGVSWGGRQAIDLNWFPGNPVGVVQVIGAQLASTTITGKWKDIFLSGPQNEGSRGQLLNFPQLQGAATPTGNERAGNTFAAAGSVAAQFAERARALRDAFELLRKEGQQVKVEWGSIVRYGFITSTLFPHDREEDIDYEIEFTFTGETDSQPVPKFKIPDLLGLLKKLLALLDRVIDVLLQAIFNAQNFLRRITQTINKIGSFVTQLIEALEKIASFVFAPADILGTIRSNLVAIRLTARDALRRMDQSSAALEASFTGNPLAVSQAETWQQTLRRRLHELGAEAAQQQAEIDQILVPQLLGVIVMPTGKTLRDISSEFYGTPNNWRAISDFNGFGGSLVPVGTVVRIPDV